MVDWTSSPMSSSIDTFRKRGWLVAYAFQGVLGLRGMLLYSGLFNAPGQEMFPLSIIIYRAGQKVEIE